MGGLKGCVLSLTRLVMSKYLYCSRLEGFPNVCQVSKCIQCFIFQNETQACITFWQATNGRDDSQRFFSNLIKRKLRMVLLLGPLHCSGLIKS